MRHAISRRTVLSGFGLSAASLAVPAWAQGHSLHGGRRGAEGPLIPAGFGELRGEVIDLAIGSGHRIVEGRRGPGVAINGTVPGPLIRLIEGQKVRINVTNTLAEDTSLHWHGLLVPFHMDGVPGISFPGIRPGETFTYEFSIRQSGTYWYHSHSGLQEQAGNYAPLIIEPADGEPVAADRDYILLLSDFTTHDPHYIMNRLRTGEHHFNHQMNSWSDDYPLSGAERRMWARMRMAPTDIMDIGAPSYTFLANGRGPKEGMEFLFAPGERVRLRIINGSAQSFFNLRIPDLAMTVIAADGQNVQPVEVDEFQIGTAETYDVIVEPGKAEAYAIVAEAMDRSGMALAMLASRPGACAPVPPLRDPPLLTMADMGIDHGSHAGHGTAGRHDMKDMTMRDLSRLPPDVKPGPGIDVVSAAPADGMGDPGLGLRGVAHRVLNYRMLRALEPNRDTRAPSRLLELHLTGNMKRYMWSFDGRMFSAVADRPIRFAWNERVRVKLVNNTMMAHPIHLHGMFFELVNGADAAHQPRKNVVVVQPGASAQFDLTANEPGDWAFHCHLLYHMHAGMMQTVTVMGPGQ
ncbi:MAG: copper resistance system multicopper oxidase [Novosphingobium sp.]|nr:copper resistance system multicopper oxidase [Novosphingobium sp.]